jgi:large subunit ribosomal protein L22
MAAVETREQTVRAQAKYVRSSARKARLLTDLIRGRSVPEARTILAFSTRAVARDVEKVLRSAVANAESRPDLHWNGDDLEIVSAYADEGRTLKRFRPRARGRASSIHKRTCHITIELARSEASVAAAADAAPATGASRLRRARTQEPALDTDSAGAGAAPETEPSVERTAPAQEPALDTAAVPEAEQTESPEPPTAEAASAEPEAPHNEESKEE